MPYKGPDRFPAGRLNDPASPTYGLSATLQTAGFRLGRLQTGTPARLYASSIDFSRMDRQDGDQRPKPFSFLHGWRDLPFLVRLR